MHIKAKYNTPLGHPPFHTLYFTMNIYAIHSMHRPKYIRCVSTTATMPRTTVNPDTQSHSVAAVPAASCVMSNDQTGFLMVVFFTMPSTTMVMLLPNFMQCAC